MCFGGGPVGPQKYSGGSNVSGNNNTAHEEMMSKASARRQPSQSDRPRMRGGAAPRANFLTRSIDSIFPKG